MCIHCCGPNGDGSTKVDGVKYHWDFHRYTGPQFYVGDEAVFPDENHPVWPRFNRWLKRFEGKNGSETK